MKVVELKYQIVFIPNKASTYVWDTCVDDLNLSQLKMLLRQSCLYIFLMSICNNGRDVVNVRCVRYTLPVNDLYIGKCRLPISCDPNVNHVTYRQAVNLNVIWFSVSRKQCYVSLVVNYKQVLPQSNSSHWHRRWHYSILHYKYTSTGDASCRAWLVKMHLAAAP